MLQADRPAWHPLAHGAALRFEANNRLRLGLAGALAGSRLLTGVLFGLGRWDPVTYAVALLVLLTADAAASVEPTLRAARLDPVVALRQD